MTADVLAPDPVSEKIEQALTILKSVGVPVRGMSPRRSRRVALALLAVGHLPPDKPWTEATSFSVGGPAPVKTRDIIRFWNEHYGEQLSMSSYDDVRRKDLVFLVEAELVEASAADPTADINDGTRGYAVPQGALALIRSYGNASWESELASFRQNAGVLTDRLSKARELKMVPVTLPDGSNYTLSPGPHNRIQKAIIEQFLPRFSNGAQVLYVGDAVQKILHIDAEKLNSLGIKELSREMLPDVLAYDSVRNWLFVIEAVHSSNPISPLRHMALRRVTEDVEAGCAFVSAFETREKFAKFSKEISWETDVWIADDPTHMIHFDGERYLGPY